MATRGNGVVESQETGPWASRMVRMSNRPDRDSKLHIPAHLYKPDRTGDVRQLLDMPLRPFAHPGRRPAAASISSAVLRKKHMPWKARYTRSATRLLFGSWLYKNFTKSCRTLLEISRHASGSLASGRPSFQLVTINCDNQGNCIDFAV